MTADNYQDGRLEYSAGPQETPDLESLMAGHWRDGFLLFSAGHLRYDDALPHAGNHWIKKRIDARPVEADIEGYLMEVNVWRSTADHLFEEIVWEREDNGFWVQHLRLDTQPERNDANCWYRHACTRPFAKWFNAFHNSRQSSVLDSIEVVLNTERLHFFITTGSD